MDEEASPLPNPTPRRSIGEHAIIGDLETAALVASDGTIDFLCWPSLDSPTIFAALLDPANGGAFALAPEGGDWRSIQLYLPDTNALVTQWLGEQGSAETLDLMVLGPQDETAPGQLIRMVRATRGVARFQMRCSPRLDYARVPPDAVLEAGEAIFSAPDAGERPTLHLWATVPLTVRDGVADARFELALGEEALFVLHGGTDGTPADASIRLEVQRTIAQWREWSGRSTYRGRWREQVARSALALKLLTSRRHGSIAAAATFGLPEATGAGRNWDYRATWIRDASFTTYAFMRLGHASEAERFSQWVAARMREADTHGELRIMYSLDGSEAAEETELPHLSGYGCSRPVRIGNAARDQRQSDIYGEILDSAYLFNKYGSAVSREGWHHIAALVETVCRTWRDPDAGIWEIRDANAPMLHSRLMCWVAIDRGLRLAHKRSLPAPVVRWTEERDRVAADIWTNFRHPEKGHFVQRQGCREVDAALLMMPLVRFVSAKDPVWLATLDAIRDELGDGGLFYRYRNHDGLEGGEGAFTTCTFWFVGCLARAGRLDEAQLLMEKGLRLANHVGLFSEETDQMGRPLGNFPQALTHLSFISAAFFLDRSLSNGGRGEWQP